VNMLSFPIPQAPARTGGQYRGNI